MPGPGGWTIRNCATATAVDADLLLWGEPAIYSDERARRRDRLQRTEATFDLLPFDVEAARAYGRVHAAVLERGRQPRRRFADLLIASTALAENLPLITRIADDFVGLEKLISVVEI